MKKIFYYIWLLLLIILIILIIIYIIKVNYLTCENSKLLEEKKINYRTDNIYDFKVSQEFKQMFSDTPLSTNYAGIDDYINEKTN
mgnify:FL=1|jgi:uncharacterized membrane protein YqiK